jgi:hypothetical protein
MPLIEVRGPDGMLYGHVDVSSFDESWRFLELIKRRPLAETPPCIDRLTGAYTGPSTETVVVELKWYHPARGVRMFRAIYEPRGLVHALTIPGFILETEPEAK